MKYQSINNLRITILLCLLCTHAIAADRVALVVGNSNYTVSPLVNPGNDARAISGKLRSLNFDVISAYDANRDDFENAIDRFGRKAEQANIALVFYAGHGMQVDGVNYLLPVEANPKQRRDLRRLVTLDILLDEAQQARELGLVILDACRDNPFLDQLSRSLGRSTGGRGLARVESTASNTLVAFATKEGAIADDGELQNSPYATALLKYLDTPGLDVRRLFGKVRDEVLEQTNNRQQPYVYGSLGGKEYCLAGHCETTAQVDPDQQLWLSMLACGSATCYQTYIETYPNGKYIDIAKVSLRKLTDANAVKSDMAHLFINTEPKKCTYSNRKYHTEISTWYATTNRYRLPYRGHG